jgi:hypothetical protein
MPRAPKTPVKRSSSADSSGEDKKPAAKRGKKATPASPAKKGVTWTQDLDLALFNQLYMRRTDVSWDDVALKLGVDKQVSELHYLGIELQAVTELVVRDHCRHARTGICGSRPWSGGS